MTPIFFFEKKKLKLNKVLLSNKVEKDFFINHTKPLRLAGKDDLTFFESIKYKQDAVKTKAGACITTDKLKDFLPKNVQKIIVKNVLLTLANVLKKIYPYADIDYPDISLKKPINKKYKSVKFGNNVLIGKNVKLGKNTIIGANTIIEHDVKIGDRITVSGTRTGSGKHDNSYSDPTTYRIGAITAGTAPAVTKIQLQTTAGAAITSTANTFGGLTFALSRDTGVRYLAEHLCAVKTTGTNDSGVDGSDDSVVEG